MEAFEIQGCIIVNKIIVDSLTQFPGMYLVDASAGGDIGWKYVDGQAVPPEEED